MDAFAWGVVGSVAAVVAVAVAIVVWLVPSPRRRDSGTQSKQTYSIEPSDLPASGESAEQGPRSGQVIFGEIPQRSTSFEERPELQDQLTNSQLSQRAVSSLIGIRGAGKSQLAAAVVRKRLTEGWRLVAWLNAEFYGQLIQQLSQLAAELGLSPGDSEATTASARFKHWLEADGDRCLLIFDNAMDADALQSVLPVAGKAQVIITSSRRPLSNVGNSISVGAFTPAQAVAFLASRTGRSDEPEAGAVAADLGYLPLALSQAAAVLIGQNLDYATYRTRLASIRVSEYLTHVEGDSYPLGVAEAITLSMSVIEEGLSGQVYRQVLELLSLLSPSGISRRLLYAATGDDLTFAPFQEDETAPFSPITLRKITQSEPAIDEALQVLSDASLLTWSIDGSFLLVHRLVARVVRERADHDDTLSIASDRAVSILARIWDEKVGSDDQRDRKVTREIVAHVTALSKNLTPFHQPRDHVYSELLNTLQVLAAAYLAGYLHGHRDSGAMLEESGISNAQIAELESLAADMEGLRNSTAGDSISRELSELKEYLARIRRQDSPES